MKTRPLAYAGIATALFFAVGLWVYILMPRPTEASRNSSGTMAAINGPYTAGTVISSSTINARLADIETELTDSKSRSGKGDFSAPVRTADGVVTAPSFAFTSETGTGLYRIGSSDLGVAINQSKQLELTSTLFTVIGTARFANGLVGTPAVSFTNDTGSGFYRIGSNDIGFAINGSKTHEWIAGGETVTGTLGVGAAAPHTSSVLFATGGTPALSVTSITGLNTRLYSNSYSNGANDIYYANGFAGQLELGGPNSADFTFRTAPSGTAAGTVTYTTRMVVNQSGITGNGGSTVTAWSHGGCTLNGASPAVCTATIVSGQICGVSYAGTTAAPTNGIRASNSAGTVTFTGVNGQTDGINYVCF